MLSFLRGVHRDSLAFTFIPQPVWTGWNRISISFHAALILVAMLIELCQFLNGGSYTSMMSAFCRGSLTMWLVFMAGYDHF
jgi:hypothetical protein